MAFGTPVLFYALILFPGIYPPSFCYLSNKFLIHPRMFQKTLCNVNYLFYRNIGHPLLLVLLFQFPPKNLEVETALL